GLGGLRHQRRRRRRRVLRRRRRIRVHLRWRLVHRRHHFVRRRRRRVLLPRLLLAHRLHVLDVAVDLLPLFGGDLLFLGEVLVELVDRLVGLAQLLVAAPDVA